MKSKEVIFRIFKFRGSWIWKKNKLLFDEVVGNVVFVGESLKFLVRRGRRKFEKFKDVEDFLDDSL